MNDLITGMLIMNMDIYSQFDKQDQNTGAIKSNMQQLTEAFYETAKYLLYNNSKRKASIKLNKP